MIVFCRVREADGDVAGKRFYVHEVFDEDEKKRVRPFKPAPPITARNPEANLYIKCYSKEYWLSIQISFLKYSMRM